MSKWKKENAIDEALQALLRPQVAEIGSEEPPGAGEPRMLIEERKSLSEGVATAFAEAQHWEEMHQMLSAAESERSQIDEQKSALLADLRKVYVPIRDLRSAINHKESLLAELRFHLSFFITAEMFEKWLQEISAASNAAEFKGQFDRFSDVYARVLKSIEFFELRPHIKNVKTQLNMLTTLSSRLSKVFMSYFEHQHRAACIESLRGDKKKREQWLHADTTLADQALGIIRDKLSSIADALEPKEKSFLRTFSCELRNRQFKDNFAGFYIRELWEVLPHILPLTEQNIFQLLSSFVLGGMICSLLLHDLFAAGAEGCVSAEKFAEISAASIKILCVSCRHIANFESFLRILSVIRSIGSTNPAAIVEHFKDDGSDEKGFHRAFDVLVKTDGQYVQTASTWLDYAGSVLGAELETYLRKWLHLQAVSPDVDNVPFGELAPAAKRVIYLITKARQCLPRDINFEQVALEHYSQAVIAQAALWPAQQKAIFMAQNLLFIVEELQKDHSEVLTPLGVGESEGTSLDQKFEELQKKAYEELCKAFNNSPSPHIDTLNELMADLSVTPNLLRQFLLDILSKHADNKT